MLVDILVLGEETQVACTEKTNKIPWKRGVADRGHPSVLYLNTFWALKATRLPGFLGNGESLRQSNPANHTACHQAQPWPPPKYSNSDTTLDQYNIKTIHIRNWKLNLISSNHTACHRPQPRPPSSSDRQLAGDRWPAERREGPGTYKRSSLASFLSQVPIWFTSRAR